MSLLHDSHAMTNVIRFDISITNIKIRHSFIEFSYTPFHSVFYTISDESFVPLYGIRINVESVFSAFYSVNCKKNGLKINSQLTEIIT